MYATFFTFERDNLLENTTDLDQRLRVRMINIRKYMGRYIKNNPQYEHIRYCCHSTCRAFSKIMPELKVIDGHYMGISREESGDQVKIGHTFCDHSWLETPDGAIIDPCPIGVITWDVLLIPKKGDWLAYGNWNYIPDNDITKRILNEELNQDTQAIYDLIIKAREKHQIYKNT